MIMTLGGDVLNFAGDAILAVWNVGGERWRRGGGRLGSVIIATALPSAI